MTDSGVSFKGPFQMRRCRPASGFSLLELLVVMAIIVAVLSFALPAFNQTTGGFEMTSAADAVIAQFSQARQTAIARNRNVEVRIYSYKEDFGDEERYQAMQSFIAEVDSATSWEALGQLQKLPSRIAFDSGSTLSPLIGSQTPKSGEDAGFKMPGVGDTYKYVTVTFRPDGSILPNAASAEGLFLTIKESRLDDPGTALPNNYAIVQIFPPTGLIRSYRP